MFELRAATSLARHWRARGRGADARALLSGLLAGFTEGFTTLDFKEALELSEEGEPS
jgi:predicted ATPase